MSLTTELTKLEKAVAKAEEFAELRRTDPTATHALVLARDIVAFVDKNCDSVPPELLYVWDDAIVCASLSVAGVVTYVAYFKQKHPEALSSAAVKLVALRATKAKAASEAKPQPGP
jgi:hypothetical protein